jgi:hypothetical protein
MRPEDRLEYIRGLQQEQAGQGSQSFDLLLYRRLDATFGEYRERLARGADYERPGAINQTRPERKP